MLDMQDTLFGIAARLTDDELLRRVRLLATREREATVELVAHLAEMDTRKLHLAQGYGSLFSYCTEVLRLAEHAAYNRIEAARASRKFPVVMDRLADGSLNLSSVRLLAPHLTPENHESVLDEAARKSKREVEALVARLAPRPDVPPSVRKLAPHRQLPQAPAASAAAGTAAPAVVATTDAAATVPSVSATATGATEATDVAEVTAGTAAAAANECAEATGVDAGTAAGTSGSPVEPGAEVTGLSGSPASLRVPTLGLPAVPPATSLSRPLVVPLSPQRYRVQFTVGRETHDNLRRAQDLLRREIPDGDPGLIFDRALRLLLEDIARKKLAATSKPRPGRPTAERSRHVPAHVKRAVWLRDGGQCAFVARSGRRCRERAILEFHHVDPYAIGGETTSANLSLRCRAHNVHEAERLFGPFAPVVRGSIWHSVEPDDRTTRPGAS
jgi:hypothetical protein